MSLQDPIADMFTRIRNAQKTGKKQVTMQASTFKVALSEVLKQEGYILDFDVHNNGQKKYLVIDLKYFEGQPVINKIERVSRPGLRHYKPSTKLPRVLGGFGTAIISTSRGVMSDRKARSQSLGGEVICFVE